MSARIKTELWVQAFLRRCNGQGLFAAVLKRGNAEAGSLIIVVSHLDGTHTLLTPPPGPAYDEEGERRFEMLSPNPQPWADVQSRIDKAKSFDSDLWIVEVEDREGLAGLSPVKS
jgi:hypothetical protein